MAELKAKDAEERRLAEREAARTRAAQAKAARDAKKAEAKKAPEPKAGPESGKKAGEPKTEQAAIAAPPRAETRRKPARHAAAEPKRRAYRERVASRSCETAGTQIEPPGWYVVKQGDTLWAIAEKHYGAGWRYKRIYAANRRRLHGPHRISPCQRVYLPRAVRRA